MFRSRRIWINQKLLPNPRIKTVVILTTTTTKILQYSAISGWRLVISMPFVIHCCLRLFVSLFWSSLGEGEGVNFLWKCNFWGETSKMASWDEWFSIDEVCPIWYLWLNLLVFHGSVERSHWDGIQFPENHKEQLLLEELRRPKDSLLQQKNR